jgi:hypothetical protein
MSVLEGNKVVQFACHGMYRDSLNVGGSHLASNTGAMTLFLLINTMVSANGICSCWLMALFLFICRLALEF